MSKRTLTPLLLALALLGTGCGSSSGGGTSTPASTPGSTQSGGGSVLAADARSAATGDIPDTQNFLTLSAPSAHVSMLYPEGWTVKEAPAAVSIADKNNLVRITLARGAAPTTASVQAQLAALARSTPGLSAQLAQSITLRSGPAVKVAYRTLSAPNPVTGKQVELIVDRYALAHAGRVAIIDLGTPVGVDNVDAYRKMIESFKWL